MQLLTLDLPGGTAAGVLMGPGRAFIPGSLNVPLHSDIGSVLRTGELEMFASRGGEFVEFTAGQLRRPILDPGGVFCIGLNYRKHIAEMGEEVPAHPTIFSKLSRALTDPAATVNIPAAAQARLDYEGELVVIVGKAGRNISAKDAPAHIAGFTIANDVSMRDWQQRTVQWFAGKSWQRCTPVGPVMVTPDELGDLADHELVVAVNGTVRQKASLGDLAFDVSRLICDISTIVDLAPGDLILTGTPGGVGDAMDPPGYLSDGDEVTVCISGIGLLRNEIRFEYGSIDGE